MITQKPSTDDVEEKEEKARDVENALLAREEEDRETPAVKTAK